MIFLNASTKSFLWNPHDFVEKNYPNSAMNWKIYKVKKNYIFCQL